MTFSPRGGRFRFEWLAVRRCGGMGKNGRNHTRKEQHRECGNRTSGTPCSLPCSHLQPPSFEESHSYLDVDRDLKELSTDGDTQYSNILV